MKTKTCFKCAAKKPLSEFYRHPAMADGHLGKCKDCAKKDVARRAGRLGNNPEWLMAERDRSRRKMAKARAEGRFKKQSSREVKERWRLKNKYKHRAEAIARHAKLKGEITVPFYCQRCGIASGVVMHHPDYSRPKHVQWLCTACHGIVHRKPAPVPATT